MSVLRKLPISIGEARKKLGKDAEQLSDDQIIEIIITLSLLTREQLNRPGSKKSSGLV